MPIEMVISDLRIGKVLNPGLDNNGIPENWKLIMNWVYVRENSASLAF
jgi:hypothetical protein